MSFFQSVKNLLNSNPFRGVYKINRMRPPGSCEESLFLKLCVRCSRCIEVCPYRVIQRSGITKNGEIGTPFIHAEEKGCHLCMECTSVCPTGALDIKLTYFRDVKIGIARVDDELCLNHIYHREEYSKTPTGNAMLCNQCFNVCPMKFDAIYLKDSILPTITDKCTGCGMCTERCPVRPKRAINIIPKDMPDSEEAGYHQYLKRSGKNK